MFIPGTFKRFAWVVVIGSLLASCSREGSDWNRAKQMDTLLSYRTFLADHPSSSHGDEARVRVETLTWQDESSAWERSQSLNSVDGYRRFLGLFPAGGFAAEAKATLDRLIWANEELAWAQVAELNTKESLARFLERYSESPRRAEATKRLETLDWESTRSTDTLDAYKEFAQRYRDTSRKSELDSAIKQKEYELTLAPAAVVAELTDVATFLRDMQIRGMESMNTFVSPDNPLLVQFPAKGMRVDNFGRTVTFSGGGIRVSTPDPSVKFVEGTKFTDGTEKVVYRGGTWLRDIPKPKH